MLPFRTATTLLNSTSMRVDAFRMRMRWLLAILSMAAVNASAGDAGKEVTANASITYMAKGRYAYKTIKEGRIRGTEDWTLTVHPDGSRTMMALVNNHETDFQLNMIHRVSQSFRPVETYVSQWVRGSFRGSTRVHIAGNELRAWVQNMNGSVEQKVEVPTSFSLHPHPVAVDGWRGWDYSDSGDKRQLLTKFNILVDPAIPVPLLGVLEDEAIERIGPERIAVPAGVFETEHWRFRDIADIWLHGPHRIVIKYAYPGRDREYVLIDYEESK